MIPFNLCFNKPNSCSFIFQLQCNHSCNLSLNSFQCTYRHLQWGVKQDMLFQKWSRQGQVLMWFSLPLTRSQSSSCCFHADGLSVCTGFGVAVGFTFSWLSSRLPAALISSLFSHTDSSKDQHFSSFFDVRLHVFACSQFTEKAACSVPMSCPLRELSLP